VPRRLGLAGSPPRAAKLMPARVLRKKRKKEKKEKKEEVSEYWTAAAAKGSTTPFFRVRSRRLLVEPAGEEKGKKKKGGGEGEPKKGRSVETPPSTNFVRRSPPTSSEYDGVGKGREKIKKKGRGKKTEQLGARAIVMPRAWG